MTSHASNPNTTTNTNTNNVSSPSSSFSATFDSTLTNTTTFVQADPSTFRAIVQRLTGASQVPSAHKLPVTQPARFSGKPTASEMGARRSSNKLRERRQISARELEVKLNNGAFGPVGSSSTRQQNFLGFGSEKVMVSPVSPLDLFMRGSPRSPSEEEERAIAEKGFYLHPSPLSTPRGSEPELLPLFPLHSPRDDSSPS